MPLRSILLRVLFWSLALSAVFGAGGILLASQDHEAVWRVAATSMATAGAALLLLLASWGMDKPVSRPASLLAVTLVVIEYLLTLGAIWEVDVLLGNGRYDFSLWLTVLFVALVGVPAILFMRMAKTALAALAGRVGLVLAVIEMAMLLVVAWDRSSWLQDRNIDALAGWLVPFAMMTIICLVGQGVPPRRHWRWLGVAAAAVGYALTSYGEIRQLHQSANVVVYITCIAAAIAHANVVMLCSLRPSQMWLRWATIAAGIATTAFVALAAYLGTEPMNDDLMARCAAACGIIAGCGTLAIIILARLNRPFIVGRDAMTGLSEITVICPVCRKKQSVALNGAACAECRVLIHVRVEEPKCATCGYCLLMLKSGKCPECGTAVPDSPPAIEPPATPAISL
jgi:hypothetical protein